VVVLAGVLVGVLMLQALNPEQLVLLLEVLMMHHTVLVAVSLVVPAVSNQPQAAPDLLVMLLLLLVVHHPMMLQLLQFTMLLMLKVSSKIQTHKSSVVLTPWVSKPTHKTSVFASFNHHQSQLQAHSSSEKCAHLNHQYHPHFVFVK
jgi:hypothetical protein